MAQDWSAVAIAVNRRMKELGYSQADVAGRSGLSLRIVGAVQYNAALREWGSGVLEKLSCALDWHPGHLAAVLNGQVPPPRPSREIDIAVRLDAIEGRLTEIAEQARVIGTVETRLSGLSDEMAAVVERTFLRLLEPGR